MKRGRVIFGAVLAVLLGYVVLGLMGGAIRQGNDNIATLEAINGRAATDLAELKLTATAVVATSQARPKPSATLVVYAEDVEACEAWRFENNSPGEVLIESNADMAALSLRFAYAATAARSCAFIDPSFNDDADLYLLNVVDTLKILNSWLIQEEVESDG